jgi:hypothetical protein
MRGKTLGLGSALVCAALLFFLLTPFARAQTTPLSDLDALRYIASQPDLIAAFGADAAKGRSHYETWGIKEGRKITFEPLNYTASHPDLMAAFGIDETKAVTHYIQWGFKEGRKITFNPLNYIASQPDLISAFGADAAKGARHYIQNGYAEKRQITFDPARYMASHPDLIQAFAGDETKGAMHYIQWGYKEKRQTTFSDLDALQYVASFADLIQSIGSDVITAIRHYVTSGYNAGRRITFEALAYIASFGDLISAFGTNAISGAQHYINWGYTEGRKLTFDALGYLAKYADLRAVFGNNALEATKHYITWGAAEGRTAPELRPVSLDFTSSRKEAVFYQSVVLRWAAENAQTCNASGDWSGPKAPIGRLDLPNDSAYRKIYTLTCSNPQGAVTRSVSVGVSPIEFSVAGSWRTIREADITTDINGQLANTFHGVVRLGTENRYGLVSIGWGYSGFGETAKVREPTKIQASLLAPDAAGLLRSADHLLTPDSITNGGGSVITTDFNEDGFEDIILLAQNESPFLAVPSTIFWGNASGKFVKETLADKVMAHDAQLVVINGKKKIFTGTFTSVKNEKGEWVTQSDALNNPIYTFEGGKVRFTEAPNMKATGLPRIGGMTNTFVRGGVGYPSKLVAGDSPVKNAEGKCCTSRTAVWDFADSDIVGLEPTQIFMPYLGNIERFKDIESIDGKGIPHVYRVYGRELSYDGHVDLLVAQSLWSQSNNDWPSALQVMLNDGLGKFADGTEALNPEMPLLKNELGYAPTFIDLDGSGIESILWDGSFAWGNRKRFSDYLIVNDGTGRLYLALHSQFYEMGNLVTDYLKRIDPRASVRDEFRFVGIPQSDGSVNFVALTPTNEEVSPGKRVTGFKFINVPLGYDPRKDFVRDVTVSNRNGSKRLRTWAGDDTFLDTTVAFETTIDGGLGRNRAIYSGPSSAYTLSRNADGSTVVATSGGTNYPRLRDTLKNIQTVQFSDKSVTIQ